MLFQYLLLYIFSSSYLPMHICFFHFLIPYTGKKKCRNHQAGPAHALGKLPGQIATPRNYNNRVQITVQETKGAAEINSNSRCHWATTTLYHVYGVRQPPAAVINHWSAGHSPCRQLLLRPASASRTQWRPGRCGSPPAPASAGAGCPCGRPPAFHLWHAAAARTHYGRRCIR